MTSRGGFIGGATTGGLRHVARRYAAGGGTSRWAGVSSPANTFVILRELANKMMLQTAADALAAEQAPDTLH